MSIKDRLAKKTQDLVMPTKGDVPINSSSIRTGPGQMLMVNSLMKESNEKVALLEARLRLLDSGTPTLLLDTELVSPSRWANRLKDSFLSPEFDRLKAEIGDAGGNIQPIKVRPLKDHSNRFEIIFGHRRHRACELLRLPVLAVVEDLSDIDLFKQMDRENRVRADLSPWEQGTMYRKALNDELFSSREHLSRELGVDPGNLSKALRLADLDPVLIEAFSSPLHLQYRWAKPLADAFEFDRERVSTELVALKNSNPLLTAKQIFDRLTNTVAEKNKREDIFVGKKIVAQIYAEGLSVSVRFSEGLVDAEKIKLLHDFICQKMF